MMRTTISAELVTMLIRYASKIGINTENILKQAGIKSSNLSNLYERIELEKFGVLWNEVLLASNDPDFGLNFGISGYSIKGGGILASILKNCPTLGVAIEKLFRYHDLSGEISQFELVQQGGIFQLSLNPFILVLRYSVTVLKPFWQLFFQTYTNFQVEISLSLKFILPTPDLKMSHCIKRFLKQI